MCRDNVKAISPDALYFGSRFAWRNKNAVAAAAEYCDVVSFNLYMYDISFFKMYDELKDKPLIIGEFSMSRSDYGHFWKGPQQAANGEDQTALFNHFLGGVLRHPELCWRMLVYVFRPAHYGALPTARTHRSALSIFAIRPIST